LLVCAAALPAKMNDAPSIRANRQVNKLRSFMKYPPYKFNLTFPVVAGTLSP
jgi:hypothetical protein